MIAFVRRMRAAMVTAWNAGDTNPLIRSFVRIAAAYRG